MGVRSLFKQIKDGKEGKNVGISMGLPDLDKILYGIQRKSLNVVGADTAGGKTSFALDVYVYNALKNRGDKQVDILFYSFEMSAESLYAKLLSRYLYDNYGKVLSYEEILSFTSPISDEDYKLLLEAQKWLESVEQFITIYDKQLTPNAIYATLKEWLRRFGEFITLGDHKEDYIEHDSEAYRIVLVDHVGLISGQGSKKERIDKVVDFLIYFREKCSITGVLVQQLNRNAKSMDRKLNGYETVQLDDFQDTSGTTQGANVVIALYFPYREKIPRCEGYPVQNILRQNFRLIQILKNRFGRADVNKGTTFHGEIGMFRELPRPEEIMDYDEFLDLEYVAPDPIVIDKEKCFIDDCRYIESLYNNIKFFGGNRKYDWKVLYNFENKDVPNLIDRYSSTTSLFKSDKKLLAVLDDLYPKLYAKLKNKQLIKEHNDKEGYLFIDFINIR